MLDDLADYRVPRRPSESPRATARRVAGESSLPPPAAEALRRVALAEERASYAGAPGPVPPGHADLDRIRRGLAASVDRRTRWRARLFPASAFTPARTGAVQLAEAAARFQSGVGRLSGRQWPGWRRAGREDPAGKMSRRHEGRARQGRDVERLGVLTVHPVTGLPQPDQIR